MDRMKEYKQLIKELSSKTVVFAFGRFNPPTTGHELLVKAVKKLAQQKNADHAIYASRSQDAKKNPLSVDKKVKYLKLMFPKTTFVAANEEARTFIEAAKQLNKKYKNIVMVGGSDRVQEFKRLLNTYNGKDFHFDTIDVVSAGERDPDADDASGMSASKMRALAVKGDFAEFKKGLPSTVRDIDGKRLMNDIREGMGLSAIKEQIVLVKDGLREQYFRGAIFNVGDIVESSGQQYTIAKRGSNHLLLKESTGKLVSKWIQDVQPIQEEITMNEELTNKTLKPNDKIKVARIISTMLGIENAETSSNPENLINSALRKVRTKALNPEALAILDKMLALATEVGIDYDTALKPTKLKEGVIQPSGTDQVHVSGNDVTPKPKATKKGVLTFYNFQKEHKESQADNKKDNESDIDADHDSHKMDKKEVGHTLVSPGGQDNLRRRKVKYHLGEQTGMQIADKIQKKGMTSYGKESGHENTAQHIATNPEHSKKEKKLALSFIQKMQGVAEATNPAEKAAKETAKANLAAKHAKEKESLADKQTRERESLKEKAPPGFEGTVKAMKKHPEIDNPYALSWYLKNKGAKSHRNKDGSVKEEAISEAAPFKTKEDAVKYAKEKVKTHRDSLDGIEIHAHSGGFDVNHTSNSSGRNSLQKIGAKHVGTIYKEETIVEGAYEKSEENKRSADAAKKQGDMFAHHLHMSDYHENLAQWHSEKGRHSVADSHAEKAEQHHEKAMGLKEGNDVEYSSDYKLSPSGRKVRARRIEFKTEALAYTGPVDASKVNHAGAEPHDEEWEDTGICPEHGVKDCHDCASPVDMSDYNKDYDSEMDGLELSDEEINKMVDSVSDEEIMDEYDEEELALVDDETGEEIPPVPEEKAFDESALVEVLSRQERMRAKVRIRRTASKRERATKIALRRYSNNATINKRARRLAIKLMKQRMLRGRDPAKISVGEKERIERTLEKRKAIIGRVAQRLTSRVRKVEKARMGHTKFTQGNSNVGF